MILRELGVKTADTYRSISLKCKLQQKFGERISIINQTVGSAFICASFIPLGDDLEKLRHLEAESQIDETQWIILHAAKILKGDINTCRKDRQQEQSTGVSFSAAEKMIPNSLFNFTAMLLCDKPRVSTQGDPLSSRRVLVDQPVREKALIVSQQLLQHVAGVPTPLGIATTYHIYKKLPPFGGRRLSPQGLKFGVNHLQNIFCLDTPYSIYHYTTGL